MSAKVKNCDISINSGDQSFLEFVFGDKHKTSISHHQINKCQFGDVKNYGGIFVCTRKMLIS